VAGLATTPYAAFHFHRLAPYGVIANLMAMPIVSIWVMPTGLLALLAIPFGFDGLLWRLMGEGIGWMMTVALWVASLPGAVGRLPAFGIAPLLLCTAGLVVVCLLKTPLRWCGDVLMALAAVLAIRAPQPEVLVASDGPALAVRGPDGRLAILRQGRRRLHRAGMAGGERRCPPANRSGAARKLRLRSVRLRCQARRRQNRVLRVGADAFEEDCARTALVVTAREGPPRCAATLVDRRTTRCAGDVSLSRDGWEITAARPAGQDRPWARAMATPAETAQPTSAARPQPRDATPRLEDLEPGDQ
jgi:competence protein ComEC